MKVLNASIRLFRKVPIETFPKLKTNQAKLTKASKKETLKTTINHGFLLSDKILDNASAAFLNDLIKIITNEISLSPEQMNNALHKSWDKVKNAPMIQLVMEQMLHYITTYGFEALGIYDDSTVFIPYEKLDLPKTNAKDIRLILIKATDKKQMKTDLLSLIGSGIALKESTLQDCLTIAQYVGVNSDDLEGIANKEAKCMMYSELGIIPPKPVEFLRLVLYMQTDSTLLIKSREVIESIKTTVPNTTCKYLFKQYIKQYGSGRLASVFYRYKPLFLAWKKSSGMSGIINAIRKQAPKYHKPMKADLLNSITAMIKHNQAIDLDDLQTALDKVNIFRKIRLCYALKYRMANPDSAMYRIRNGKAYAKKFPYNLNAFSSERRLEDKLKNTYNIIMESMAGDIFSNVDGLRIYIPNNIKYALPATEKQFTGNLPSGSFVETNKDMIFGIHWCDVDHNRIDLDLSIMDADNKKYGWDGSYRSGSGIILFSGDMTSAPKPKGATELFYIARNDDNKTCIMFVNYFNFDKDIPVPTKIIVGQKHLNQLNKNYMIHPRNLLCQAETVIDKKQRMLGLLTVTKDKCRFYFVEGDLGNSITLGSKEWVQHARRYLVQYYANTPGLIELLEMAGAVIVSDPKEEFDLDLSPANINKQSIMDLLIVKE